MPPPLIQLTDIALTFGGTPLLECVDLSVASGERVCLVGRNGSGKSTLLKIAAGLVEADRGTRFVQPDATIRYLPQEPDFGAAADLLAYVEAGLAPGDDPHRARTLLERLGLTGAEDPRKVSGGEARRAALARVLAPRPDVLLLDEPTNHLDLPTIEWLEAELRASRAALVVISHDRRFLENLSRSTIWLDRGRTRRIEVGFARFEAWRDDALAEEERDRHKLDRKIAAEEDWVRYGVTARRKRNVRRLADLQALRQRRRDERRATPKAVLEAAQAERSGTLVLEAKDIAKAYGGKAVVTGFSIRVHRRDRIGIVGSNGSGKTTLLALLTGRLVPDSGTVRLGTNLEIATLDQGRESLDPDASLRDAMTGGHGDTVMVGGQAKHVVAYMRDFLFLPEQAGTPLRVLSGGERGRLMLARALARPSNVLVLDEPTNDLDLETLDVLEEMLADYAGTVLLVSHDRDFLDRVADSVLVPEGDGRWTDYAGGYSDMLAQRGGDLAPRAAVAGPRAKPKTPEPRAAKPDRARLSFNEQHTLKTLPNRIAALEQQVATLRAQLADPGFYGRDRAGFETASAALAARQAEIEAAEEQWLALELRRTAIEGG